jgi:integrase
MGDLPSNPASSVRGPKYVIKKAKTPVLSAEEARTLFDAIDTGTLAGLRDQALIGVMVYSFAHVSAVLGMNVEDYYQQGKRFWIRLHEKGGKHHEVPAHHKAQDYLDEYLAAAGSAGEKGTPLFRTLDRRRQLTGDRMERREALAMIKRRSRQAASARPSAATPSGRPGSPATWRTAGGSRRPSRSRRTKARGRRICTTVHKTSSACTR